MAKKKAAENPDPDAEAAQETVAKKKAAQNPDPDAEAVQETVAKKNAAHHRIRILNTCFLLWRSEEIMSLLQGLLLGVSFVV